MLLIPGNIPAGWRMADQLPLFEVQRELSFSKETQFKMLKLFVKAQSAIQAMKDESGQDLIEYSLIAALIAVACVTAMGTLAGKIQGVFASVGSDL